jgi:hypothetical protein
MEDRCPGVDVATVDPLADQSGFLAQLIQVKFSAHSKSDTEHVESLKKLLIAQDQIKKKINHGQPVFFLRS